MIVFNVEVNPASVRNFDRACERFEKDMGDSQGTALRRGTLTFLKMVRSQTRRSPKVVPREDVRWGESDPKYITGTKGKAKGMLFRRVVVNRWSKGKRKSCVKWEPVKMKYRGRRTKSGGISESWTEASAFMLRDARHRYGGIRNWGLAKRSWGWFMKAIFHQSMQDENPKSNIDSRMVKKEIREVNTAGKAGVEITLTNKLAYVRSAMPPGAINHALRAATRQINGFIDNELKKRAAQFGKGS